DVLQQREDVLGGGKARQKDRERREHHSKNAEHNGLLCQLQASHPHILVVCSSIILWLIVNCKTIPGLRFQAKASGRHSLIFVGGNYSKVESGRDLACPRRDRRPSSGK